MDSQNLQDNASATDIKKFITQWINFAADNGFNEALKIINVNPDVNWDEQLFDELTYDHFDDGEHCTITNVDGIDGIQIDVYPYDDGNGYAVDHDLALNGKLSDFTAQFEVMKNGNRLDVTLRDIHVL